MNDVINTIKNRRSIRAYKSEQIKQEELDAIIEAGLYAPSGHNTQPWHFTVIQNREVIRHINEVSKEVMRLSEIEWIRNMGLLSNSDLTYGAPTLVIVSGRRDAITCETDCGAAVQNMLLAAESMNIGSVWLGLITFCFKKKDEVKKINIPEGYEPIYGVAFGYNLKDTQPPTPKRNYDVVDYIR